MSFDIVQNCSGRGFYFLLHVFVNFLQSTLLQKSAKTERFSLKLKKELLTLAQRDTLAILQQKSKMYNLSLKLSHLIHLYLGLHLALLTQRSL